MWFQINYEVLKFLGWLTVVFVILALSLSVLIKINLILSKTKIQSKWMNSTKSIIRKLTVNLRKYHRVFGILALVTGLIHGYFILGKIDMHSGYFLWGAIFISAITGMIMKFSQGKPNYMLFRKIHFFNMIIVVILLIYHII